MRIEARFRKHALDDCKCAFSDLAESPLTGPSISVAASYPKGCYYMHIGDTMYGAYYNTHSTGVASPLTIPVCKVDASTITTRRRRGDPTSTVPGTEQSATGTCAAGCTPGGLSAGGFMGLLSMGN